MAQLEGFNIADDSPVSKSIIDQTDNILDDEKEIARNKEQVKKKVEVNKVREVVNLEHLQRI